MQRSRGFVFTINNWTRLDCGAILEMTHDPTCIYVIAAFEVGENKKTPHIQGYVYFKNARTKYAVKETYLNNAWVAPAKASGDKAFRRADYCRKDGDYYEYGIEPEQGRIGKDKLHDIMVNPYDNVHVYQQYKKTYDQLQQMELKQSTKKTRFLKTDNCPNYVDFIYSKFKKHRIAFISKLEEYEIYAGDLLGPPEVVVYECDTITPLIKLYPRGTPIAYKFGYEYKVMKPDYFVIVSDVRERDLSLYREIKNDDPGYTRRDIIDKEYYDDREKELDRQIEREHLKESTFCGNCECDPCMCGP